MKKLVIAFSLMLTTFSASNISAQIVISDSVSMGAGYANAVYYNIRTGAESKSPMSTWHFAHTTVSRDNCIRVNHMAGIEVFACPNSDNSKFSSMDTSGWAGWKKFYNDINIHENGALNQSLNKANMWDFSWGVYDPTTKEVTGDSLYLFVISTQSGSKTLLKFMPIKQLANGDLIFRTALIDGSNDKTDTLLQSNFPGKSYKYYHFTNGDVQPEPSRDDWDLLFTRYYALTTPPMGGAPAMYPIMGVESKRGARVSKVTTYSWDIMAASPAQTLAGVKMTGTPAELSKDLTKIGGDWKAYDGAAMAWTLQKDWNYVVESVRNLGANKDTVYYMLSFTGFTGSGKGESQFRKLSLTPTASAKMANGKIQATLFPNPVQNDLMLWIPQFNSEAKVQILSIQGHVIAEETYNFQGDNTIKMNIANLSNGQYIINVVAGSDKLSLPFVKQ